ncbi:MAG: hypothetical protein ACLU5I_02815 [Alistipes finegoldii]
MVLVTCRATVGVVSNIDHSLESSGKAGRELARPSSRNRGVVMNPSSPMGGGEAALGGSVRARVSWLWLRRVIQETTSSLLFQEEK